MAATAAYLSTIKIGSNTIQDIMTWDLPFKMATVATTAFGGSGGAAVGVETYIPTLFSLQAKATASWNKADTTGQLLLENAFFARTTVTLIISPNGTNTYTFTAYVADYNIKADVKNKIDCDYTFQVTSAVTVA